MAKNDAEYLKTWNQIELRMAFYAGIVKHQQLTISVALAQKWRDALPRAIEEEYVRINSGELPRCLSVKVVLCEGGDISNGADSNNDNNGEDESSFQQQQTSAANGSSNQGGG